MASALYPKFKEALLSHSPSIDFDADTIRAIFVTSGYSYNSAHDFFNDLTNTIGDGGTGRTNGEALLNKTLTNGVLDADDTVFASVTGSAVNAIVLYKDDGSSDSTSPLIAYIDGISFTPNGGQVTIQWDSGGNKIFAL
jgi:hypothetical protein